MPTTAAIAYCSEALRLAADELLIDLDYRAEVNALTPEIKYNALPLFTKARQRRAQASTRSRAEDDRRAAR
jgi:hypothetical protein